MTISVAIVAMDEEANIGRTLASVAWADEIVLVDSGSKDRTCEIAREHGARVVVEPWRGYVAQKQYAIELCTKDWVLLLDADEEISPGLAEEIRAAIADPNAVSGYLLPRKNLFLGRWIRHGGFYPDHKLRLFKRGAARLSEGVGPHSTPQFEGPRGKLTHDMLHYAYPTMSIYLEHMNRYSSEIAQLLYAKGRTSRSLPAFLWNTVANPVATFLYNYFFRLGFLDGREGLILHLNHSAVYIHGKFIKAWWMGKSKD